jgi:hypothetical protein
MSFPQSKKRNDAIFIGMNVLLREYIKSIILEIQGNANVPNQLPGTKKPGKNKEEKEKEVDEMSTVAGSLGGGGGFTAPLGYSGKDAEGPAAKGERGKRKKPGWH